jgi:hypothetical protein
MDGSSGEVSGWPLFSRALLPFMDSPAFPAIRNILGTSLHPDGARLTPPVPLAMDLTEEEASTPQTSPRNLEL